MRGWRTTLFFGVFMNSFVKCITTAIGYANTLFNSYGKNNAETPIYYEEDLAKTELPVIEDLRWMILSRDFYGSFFIGLITEEGFADLLTGNKLALTAHDIDTRMADRILVDVELGRTNPDIKERRHNTQMMVVYKYITRSLDKLDMECNLLRYTGEDQVVASLFQHGKVLSFHDKDSGFVALIGLTFKVDPITHYRNVITRINMPRCKPWYKVLLDKIKGKK